MAKVVLGGGWCTTEKLLERLTATARWFLARQSAQEALATLICEPQHRSKMLTSAYLVLGVRLWRLSNTGRVRATCGRMVR